MVEFAGLASPDDKRPDNLVRPEERNDQNAAKSCLENDFEYAEAAFLH